MPGGEAHAAMVGDWHGVGHSTGLGPFPCPYHLSSRFSESRFSEVDFLADVGCVRACTSGSSSSIPWTPA